MTSLTALPVQESSDFDDPPPKLPAAPAANFAERLSAVKASSNPLLEASGPLLRGLADMPQHLLADEVTQLRLLLEQEVHTFQKLCEQANIRRDHALGARYCLCTALDERAMQTPWAKDGRGSLGRWITDGLATTFHEDRDGGDKVYYLIGRLMT